MNSRFIYDEKTGSLYAPDGSFLKVVNCPKAKHWNQLIVEAAEDRWRNCKECNEKVIDLDVMDVDAVTKLVGNQWSTVCIHASKNSDNVIFLRDINALSSVSDLPKKDGKLIIKTARSIRDINRAVAMGYWPDVREVEYKNKGPHSTYSIVRNVETGEILEGGWDRHRRNMKNPKFEELIPIKEHSPYYESSPVAAYLLPKDIADDTKVIIEDPIEDDWVSNRPPGFVSKRKNVPAFIIEMRVFMLPRKIEVEGHNWVG